MPADGHALVRANILSGGHVAPIVPQNFDDAYRIANALALSGITPFKKPEECLAVIMAGAEVGLTPFAATQSFAVINGRVSIWGDGMMAVVRAHGVKVEERSEGEGDAQTAICTVTRPDTGEAITRRFTASDAKAAGLWNKAGPWTQYRPRMMQMRARSWALRDGCADILRGLKMAEEMQDVPAEPQEARLVDSAGDQRPADERVSEYRVIGGQAGKDAFDDLAQRMSDCEDGAALEIVWSEAERANLSSNRTYALSEHYEACKEALEHDRAPPKPPRFSEPPAPSPFAALKAAGEQITDQDGFQAWATALTQEALGKCSEAERHELRDLYAAKKSAGAGGKSDGDAEQAVTSGAPADQRGLSARPASPFEALKTQGMAIVQLSGQRRQRNHYVQWLEDLCIGKPRCSPLEQQDLDLIQANIAKEIGF